MFLNFIIPKCISFSKVAFSKITPSSKENEIHFGIIKFRNINFKNTTFNSKIDFQNRKFINTNFERAIFKKTPNFERATFEDEANFGNTIFEDEADFGNTTFADLANFQGAIFRGEANFQGAIFECQANFQPEKSKKATFENEANFKKAIFKEEANFQRVKFNGETDFFDAIFDNIDGKKIDFSNTTFKKNVKFDFSKGQAKTELNTERYVEISFENATFEKKATFRRRKFAGDTSFIDAKFYYPPTFSAGEEYNPDLLNFTRTKLILSKTPHTWFLWKKDIEKNIEKDTRKDNKNKGSTKLTRVRNLRKLTGQIKEHDFETDLFILERIMNSRINGSKCSQQFLIFLYWGFSDYARKAWLPLTYLLGSVLGLSIFLSCVNKFNFWDALIVSATNAIPFMNKFSEKTQSIFNKYFGMEEIPNCFFWISTIHSLFSIVMIFLFSLAIRNYFRIK